MKSNDIQSSEPSHYVRPHTRGELVSKLRVGIPCEVVADNVSITQTLIDGWLDPPPYIVRPSENDGWMIFERKT
jgi:hypothetical protein